VTVHPLTRGSPERGPAEKQRTAGASARVIVGRSYEVYIGLMTIPSGRLQTGVPGLDSVLDGGLIGDSLYLLKGAPGTGKTTIGLQFLLEGARRGEKCLYLGLSETRGQLDSLATSFGWRLDGIEIHDMRRRGESDDRQRSYTVFSPSEVELEEISREILEQVDRVRPARLVIDSLSEIRLLAEDPFRYRRELLVLSDQISGRGCTGLLLDVDSEGTQGAVAETLVSGVLVLDQLSPEYGGDRRRLRVRKLRASRCIGGYHDLVIGEGGVKLFPRLVASDHRARHASSEVLSGVKELDALLGGGLDRGTSTVLLGPAGTGKSTIAAQFVTQAASRGEKSVIFCFDENPTNLLIRTTGLGIPLQRFVDAGTVQLVAVDPAEFSPGELAYRVRAHVEEGDRLIVIDSMNGYISAMPEERFLAAHLHELLAYLAQKGVATLLTLAQHGFFGSNESPINISYIADTVLLFRYFEAAGEVKQALSVVKKRTGAHERTIRELKFGPGGVRLGEPLRKYQGVLAGSPQLLDPALVRGEREPSE
jgi:circadian clock protein KaiC